MPGRVVWAYDPDCVDWDGEGYWWELDNFDETVIQRMVDDSIASLGGKVNYLPTCVTQANYVINLANLKGHSYGITLCGKNHFGSFINGNLMRPPEGANLHQWLTRNEMGIYSPLVDLMANADLGGKTVLYMPDALICAPPRGRPRTLEQRHPEAVQPESGQGRGDRTGPNHEMRRHLISNLQL